MSARSSPRCAAGRQAPQLAGCRCTPATTAAPPLWASRSRAAAAAVTQRGWRHQPATRRCPGASLRTAARVACVPCRANSYMNTDGRDSPAAAFASAGTPASLTPPPPPPPPPPPGIYTKSPKTLTYLRTSPSKSPACHFFIFLSALGLQRPLVSFSSWTSLASSGFVARPVQPEKGEACGPREFGGGRPCEPCPA